MIYFDHAATTRLDNRVLDEMLPYLTGEYGNPSSIYSLGQNSKYAINVARMRVASSINCNSGEIIFTSGGTESDNLAIKGIAMANRNYRKPYYNNKN